MNFYSIYHSPEKRKEKKKINQVEDLYETKSKW